MKAPKIILFILFASMTAFSQLDYSPSPRHKDSAVKMHFAIKLFRGVNPQQEQFLVRAIRDRRAISEVEASQLFTRDELRDVFFGIGRGDVTDFKRIYERGRIEQKKAVWRVLTRDEQNDVRRINFAWGVGYLNLNETQIDFLLRFSKALPGVTREEAAIFEAEALTLFPKEVGWLLFGSIGTYTDQPCVVPIMKVRAFGNCTCSKGSSFNMSCDNGCDTAVCTVTDDGCGFAWLFKCDGGCVGVPINN